jgi:hypothetical protein
MMARVEASPGGVVLPRSDAPDVNASAVLR